MTDSTKTIACLTTATGDVIELVHLGGPLEMHIVRKNEPVTRVSTLTYAEAEHLWDELGSWLHPSSWPVNPDKPKRASEHDPGSAAAMLATEAMLAIDKMREGLTDPANDASVEPRLRQLEAMDIYAGSAAAIIRALVGGPR